MSIHEGTWTEGTAAWADLQVDDVTAARAFYADLFGWEIADGPDESGGYLLALLDGRPAAGLGPKMSGDGSPSVWTTYFAADSADAVAERVAAAGGAVFVPPFDVNESGRMAVAADPAGAVFGVWEAGRHSGAGVVNEHGALCWNEARTRQHAISKKFYADVFGYAFMEIEEGDSVYSLGALGESGDAILAVQEDLTVDPELGAYWLTWFAVSDVDAAALRVGELGGATVMAPSDTAFGRMAIVRGAQGERLGLVAAAHE